ANVHDGLVQQRAFRLHQVGEFEVALARHSADLKRAAGFLDAGHALDEVQVDDVVGQHEAHVEHRHQRLAAGQKLGIVERAQEADSLGKGFRIVILKGWRFHRGPDARVSASIGNRGDREQPNLSKPNLSMPVRRAVVFSLLALAALLPQGARAQGSVADFYLGRNVNLIVGYSPGGGYDTYTRILARHLGKHIPGNPAIVVQNMPGAGSLKLANYLYNVAPKDG